jgi:hypothetical protein
VESGREAAASVPVDVARIIGIGSIGHQRCGSEM